MKKINEIFYSIQGEGRYTGKAAIFIRFCRCNLKCPFCDTDFKNGRQMTDEEILTEVKKYPQCKFVVLTGGEPTLQIDKQLIDLLKRNEYFVAIETNGTNDILYNIDWVTVSPKFDFCKNAQIKKQYIDELKVVVDENTDIKKYEAIAAANHFLQPCDTGDTEKNRIILNKCVEAIKENPMWRLSLQTQKIITVK